MQIPHHKLALIDVPKPVGRNGGEDRAFVEVVADDLGGKGEESPIVGNLGSDCIDHSHALPSDAVRESWYSQIGIAAQNHRIEPLVGDTCVNDVHLVQAGNGFEIDFVIQNKQIATLH